LMVLGIFGEYLGRMYMETKRRPLYFVNEIVSRSQAVEDGELPVHRLQEMAKRAARA
ncbi:glycosyltransferase, partial [Mesorhizobium sp. M7A.F.Ca.CA.001.08.2.1]